MNVITILANPRFNRFVKFHIANPHIFDQLKKMALVLKKVGHKRWGMRNLWEKLRYDLAIANNSGSSEYKLNDHFPPFYARLLMRDVPELDGFFEIRGIKEILLWSKLDETVV